MMDIVFQQRELFPLVLIIFGIAFLYWILYRAKNSFRKQFGPYQARFCASPYLFWLKTVFICSAVFFSILALSRPQKAISQKEQPEFERLDEIALIIDISRSMDTKDLATNQSRLERAKEIVSQLLEKSGGINVSLWYFSDGAIEACPATMDYLFLRFMLTQDFRGDVVEGTDFSSLFETLKKSYLKGPFQKKVAFLLLSDGEETTTLPFNKESSLKAAKALSSEKSRFYTIGLGSSSGGIIPDLGVFSRPDFDFLKEIAKEGGYFIRGDSLSAQEIAQQFVQTTLFQKSAEEQESNLFWVPLIFAIFFLLLFLITPLRLAVLIFVFVSCPLFSEGEAAKALSYFEAGSLDLSVNTFSEALAQKQLSGEEEATYTYDLATVLLFAHKIDEAIKSFSKINPQAISSSLVKKSYLNNYFLARLKKMEQLIQKPEIDDLAIKSEKNEIDAILKKMAPDDKKRAQEQLAIVEGSLQLRPKKVDLSFLFEKELELIGSRSDLYSEAAQKQLRELYGADLAEWIKGKKGDSLILALDQYYIQKKIQEGSAEISAEIEKGFSLVVEAETFFKEEHESIWQTLANKRKEYAMGFIAKKIEEAPNEGVVLLKRSFLPSCDFLLYLKARALPQAELFRKVYLETAFQSPLFLAFDDSIPGGELVTSYLPQTKEPFLDLWIDINWKDCLSVQLQELEKNFQKDAFLLLVHSWKRVEKKPEVADVKDTVSAKIVALEAVDPETTQLLLKAIYYDLFLSKGADLQRDGKTWIQFAKDYVASAKNYRGSLFDPFSLTTLAILKQIGESKKVPPELQKEAFSIFQLGQEAKASRTTFIYFQERTAEFLEKIAPLIHKEKEEKQKETPPVEEKPTQAPFTFEEARQFAPLIFQDDVLPQKAPLGQGVERPW